MESCRFLYFLRRKSFSQTCHSGDPPNSPEHCGDFLFYQFLQKIYFPIQRQNIVCKFFRKLCLRTLYFIQILSIDVVKFLLNITSMTLTWYCLILCSRKLTTTVFTRLYDKTLEVCWLFLFKLLRKNYAIFEFCISLSLL